MGRRVFVSYSREDAAAVEQLVRHLEAGGHDIWLDRRVGGGHDWWNTILQEIRERDVFIAAVSTASIESSACAAELSYASALRRPLVPVSVSSEVSGRRLPAELARIQLIDYHERTAEAAIALVRTVSEAPEAAPLPEPLPVPPPVPMSYMVALQERLSSSTPMSPDEQASTLMRLKSSLLDHHESADARALLNQMLRRVDLLASSQREITTALAAAPPVAPPAAMAAPLVAPVPAPPAAAPNAGASTALRPSKKPLMVGIVSALAAAGIVGGVVAASKSSKQAAPTTTVPRLVVSTSTIAQNEVPARPTTTVSEAPQDSETVASPSPASQAQVNEATLTAADIPGTVVSLDSVITAPCSDTPAFNFVPVVATGSHVQTTNFIFSSQAGSFATSAEAGAFVRAMSATASCRYAHPDGMVEEVIAVQTVPGMPAGMASALVQYVVTLPNGQTLHGQDAYLAIGRYVGVFTCVGNVGDEAALGQACSAYGEAFGTKLGGLYDRYG